MNARWMVALLFGMVSFGVVAWGQNSTQVFTFKYSLTPAGMQQITNAVRTVPEMPSAKPDANAKTLTVAGTPAQLAMATWILNTLDQPAPSNSATQQYVPPGGADDVVRVFYPVHPQTQRSFQEIVNAVRTIPEITKLFPITGQVFAIVVRSTAARADLAEWLFHQNDLPEGLQPAQAAEAHQYTAPAFPHEVTEVLFLSHPWTFDSMMEIVNAVRTIPELTKVFPLNETGAVSVRGPAATVALANWLFQQLDQGTAATASSSSPEQYSMPGSADDVTQIFYLAPATTARQLQTMVSTVRETATERVYPNARLQAVIVRGTAAQIAAADSAMKQ